MLRGMVDQSRMAMIAVDPHQDDQPIVFANEAFLTLTGYPEEEVLGRNCRFLQGTDTDPEAIEAIREIIRARAFGQVEILNYKRDGTPFWNALHVSPIFSEAGELAYFFGSQWDVSEKRRAIDAVEGKARLSDPDLQRAIDRNRELEFAFNQISDSVLMTEYAPLGEPGPKITWVNNGFERMTGYSADEVIGQTPRILQGPETSREEIEKLRSSLQKGKGHDRAQTVNYRKDGTPFIIEWSVSPIHDPDGKPLSWLAVQRDVTSRMEAEEERGRLIAELDHRVRNLFSTVQVLVRGAEDGDGSADALRRRILYQLEALNAAHGAVFQNTQHQPPMSEIVEAVLAPFDPDRTKVRREGDEGRFEAKQAINVAIVVYELARLSSEAGAIRTGAPAAVTWKQEGDELRMTWSEDAAPPDEGRFGFSLVRSFVRSSRWDEAGIDVGDDRFTVRLSLRAA